nr:peptidoglycan-binding protein [Vibrio kanaloae]
MNAFQCKANGNFDSSTEQAVKTFQQEYEPTHTTHENYQLGGIDGVIDKNTILALDESVVEGWKVPEINPNNMYWPPYNFLAKEGEKEIHVRYTQDVTEITALAPEEWKEFFDKLDKSKNIGGAMKGTYDAFDTAKKLGGLGVTAYVKTYNGVDYLILKGYKQHMKTLLAGNRFKASNPQVVKLGLGALDSVKGMAYYVKITAPVEVLVGSAINVLQFVLNDKYMLKDLGVDQAKLLVNALAVAGAGLFLASLAPALAATAVGSGLILVGASFSVWVVDKFTDFQKKTVNKVLELLDD